MQRAQGLFWRVALYDLLGVQAADRAAALQASGRAEKSPLYIGFLILPMRF